MRYRPLGNTDLQLSALSLGTVALGMPYGAGGETPPADSDAIALIHHAIDRGINFFDTARAYGRSEELLGKALRGRRQSVLLATKLSCLDADGAVWQGAQLAETMTRSLHTSLSLLNTDYVDLLLLHSASRDALENSDVITLLKDFQAAGKTRYIGASTYGIAAPRIAIENGFDTLQVAFNILDQRLADDILPRAQNAGTGIIARSVFLKGALSPRLETLPPRLEALKARARAVQNAAAALKPPLTVHAAALQFVLAQPGISSALVGLRDIAELDASLQAAHAPRWSDETLARFRQLRCERSELLDPSNWGLP